MLRLDFDSGITIALLRCNPDYSLSDLPKLILEVWGPAPEEVRRFMSGAYDASHYKSEQLGYRSIQKAAKVTFDKKRVTLLQVVSRKSLGEYTGGVRVYSMSLQGEVGYLVLRVRRGCPTFVDVLVPAQS